MITYSIETITPEIAKAYLELNENNYRKLRPRVISKYAADLAGGRWPVNGEAIKFHANGKLADGQHRLHAVIKSGIPLTTMVARGIPDDVSVFDCNSIRTAGDILRAEGALPYARDLSVLGAVNLLLSGHFHTADATTPARVEYALRYQDNLVEASKICRVNGGLSRKAPVVLAIYVMISLFGDGLDRDELEEFFAVVNSGFPVDGRECTPAIVLRNMMLANVFDNQDKRKTLFCATICAYRDYHSQVKRRKPYKQDKTAMSMYESVRAVTVETA